MSDVTSQRIADALVRLHALYPSMRFGQLVCFITTLARDQRDYGPYDVEDSDFLAAAERHLAKRVTDVNRGAESGSAA